MAAPIMRRLLLAFVAAFAALAAFPAAAPAQEADLPSVRLTLLAQTPWNSSYDPERGRELVVVVRAENLGDDPIGDLAIGVTLYDRVRSRTAYQESLLTDPSLVVDAETLLREGTLEPGVPRDFTISFDLDSPRISPDNSGVYPLKIDLRSGFTSLAALRTPVVFLVRQPEQPLTFSWTFVLDHPIGFGPDEVFTSPDLELAITPGGSLAAQLGALRALAAEPSVPKVDVVVTPMLLTQLERMTDGYVVLDDGERRVVAAGEGGAEQAGAAIEQLRTIARSPDVYIGTVPFAVPELPALLSGGLARDLEVQMQRGREVVQDVLGVTPSSTVLRPPGAALDEATLEELPKMGVATIVAGPSTVEPTPQPLGFAGPPTASPGQDGGVTAIIPEPDLMARLQSPVTQEDPALAARALLGELASIWQEQPSVVRGIAVVLSEDLRLPARVYELLVQGVAGAPWLDTMNVAEFATTFPPEEPSVFTAPTPRRFTETYVEELRQARRLVGVYQSMLVEPSELPDRYDTMLLLAESRQFLSNSTDGLAFITAVRDSVAGVFGAVGVDAADEITLTSSTGSGIPVTVSNGADEALRVTLQLVSQSLRGTPSRELQLGAGESQTVTFSVEALRTGTFGVAVRVLAPSGRVLTEKSDPPMIVTSTEYNRIALVITVAAAVMLLALWARRFLPRRTT